MARQHLGLRERTIHIARSIGRATANQGPARRRRM